MKEVLIFANESQKTIEIIQYLIQKHFNITIFTFKAFKDMSAFVGSSPMQVNILITNIGNYYNWKHEIHKYDIIINTLQFEDFPRLNRKTVFANFITDFAKSTAQVCAKTAIHLSNIHNERRHSKYIGENEQKMREANPSLFYIQYGFLIYSNSSFITSIMNTKFVFFSKKTLSSTIQITNNIDVSRLLVEIIAQKELRTNISLSSETFTLRDILYLVSNAGQVRQYIINIPSFYLMLASKLVRFLPQRFYPTLYNYNIILNILHLSKNRFKPSTIASHTLFSSVVNQHKGNLFASHIE